MSENFTFFIYENFNSNENSLLFPPGFSDEIINFPLESPSEESMEKLTEFINRDC